MARSHSTLEVIAIMVGMVMVFSLGLTALICGHDGTVVTATCTALGVLVGYLCGGHTPKPGHQVNQPVQGSQPPEVPRQHFRRRRWHFGRTTWEKG